MIVPLFLATDHGLWWWWILELERRNRMWSFDYTPTSPPHSYILPPDVTGLNIVGHNLNLRTIICANTAFLSKRCGYCGYALNLSSSTRNTANIGSKYGKQIRKGVVSFFAIDESRFTQTDEVSCMPYFSSRSSWGFFRNRKRLLCRKCSGHIGNAYEDEDSALNHSSDDTHTASDVSSMSSRKKYVIKIKALQPSSDGSGVPFALWQQPEPLYRVPWKAWLL